MPPPPVARHPPPVTRRPSYTPTLNRPSGSSLSKKFLVSFRPPPHPSIHPRPVYSKLTLHTQQMYYFLTIFGIACSIFLHPLFTQLLTKIFVKGNLENTKREMLGLKKQLAQISAQDEFAKWAKLKRQSESLAKEYSNLSSSHSFYSNLISWTILILEKSIFLIILWRLWDYPVFTVDNSILGFFTSWLAWPFSPIGSVSPFYVMSSARFIGWKILSCIKFYT